MSVGDSIQIGGVSYSVNETRSGESNILRIPSDARRFLEVNAGDVISDSRLNGVFDSTTVTHIINSSNLPEGCIAEDNFQIFAHQTNQTNVNIIINGKHIKTIYGSFNNDSSYTISVDGSVVGSFTGNEVKNNKTLEFYSGNNVIDISFNKTENLTSTTSAQFISSNKNSFLKFYSL
jgi:hypothetical protein